MSIFAKWRPGQDGRAGPARTEADYERMRGTVAAMDRSQAVIEFEPDGTIVTANKNFCQTMGYEVEDIKGRHHAMFAPPGVADSAEYRGFWERLGRGEFDAGQYLRHARGGREVWLQATYNPVFDEQGNTVRVVKFATDITAQKLREADVSGQLDAISKAQAIIEFELDGTIITANRNFLTCSHPK